MSSTPPTQPTGRPGAAEGVVWVVFRDARPVPAPQPPPADRPEHTGRPEAARWPCPGCGAPELRPSHPRGWERVLLLTLFRPYRCHCCTERCWRPRW